jgi:hypothetical protein
VAQAAYFGFIGFLSQLLGPQAGSKRKAILLSQEELSMKRFLTGMAVLIFAGAGSMMAQDGYYHRDRDVRRDYKERRSDRRDVRHDERKINRDRRDLRHDRYEHNYAAARNDRRDLRHDYRDLRSDKHDIHRDNRKIRYDSYR